MGKIYKNAVELIGHTPLMRIDNFAKESECTNATLLAKLEYLNPAGSVKDRVALSMIEDAEEKGILKQGSTIIEPTSGNTGIGIACVAASRGYHTILTLPETMSVERRTLLKSYGAELVLTDGSLGMAGAIVKAEELAKEIDNAVILGQFDNPANPATHFNTTGPEIWEDTEGQIDIFVAGAGTGGTISGIGAFLKQQNPAVKIVTIEPDTSAVLSGKEAGPHGLQGIGAGFIPAILNTDIIDEVVTVSTDEAYSACRLFARKEGILVGITSGAALHTAAMLGKRPENVGKTIVALLPDSGDRYMSLPIYTD